MGDVLEQVIDIAVQEAVRRRGSVTNDRLLTLAEKFKLSTEQIIALKKRLKADEVVIEGDADEGDEGGEDDEEEEDEVEEDEPPDGPDQAALADFSAIDAYLRDAKREDLLSAQKEVDLMRSIRAGEAAEKQLKVAPPELEAELRKLVRAGRRARDQFIKANLRLVVSIAKTIQSRGDLAFSDLVQEGNLGLMRAVEKFDHTRGFRFSTYASWWILAKIHRAIDDRGQVVRLPVHLRRHLNKLRKVETALTREKKGEPPNLFDIAQHMGATPGFVRFLLDVRRRAVSLDRTAGEDGLTLGDMLPAPDESKPDVEVLEKDLLTHVSKAVERLGASQRRVMTLRFGMDGSDGRTLREIGDEMGVSRERIRQIQNDALDTIPLRSRAIAEVIGEERLAEAAKERREKAAAKNDKKKDPPRSKKAAGTKRARRGG